MVTAPRTYAQRPAAIAGARAFRAGIGLGALGLACSVFVLIRLVESWHVTARSVSHHVTLFGQRLGYPAANLDAIVVLALALLTCTAMFRAAHCAAQEMTAAARLRRRLERLSSRRLGDARVIDDDQPLAFCAGLLRPRIYVSTGALDALDDLALAAVLDHERHHAQQRHPLRLAAGRVVAESLFFVPRVRELTRHQHALAELSADERAAHALPGSRSALARAMLTFADASGETQGPGFDVARVDYLLGESPTWRFPALLCVAAAAIIIFVVTIAFLAGRVAAGSATLAPPFLSRQPCVLALAIVFVLLAAFAARCPRWWRAMRRP